jgi:demethylmenaquinone methyltransferase/2-methoxy-6-polyprenyl-1,4-benzoquinol methylase
MSRECLLYGNSVVSIKRVRPATPQPLFDVVAPYYDLINTCLSFRRDRYWRKRTARSLKLQPNACVLDLATGTASLALAISKSTNGARVVGCDLNERMLRTGQQRIERKHKTDSIWLTQAAAETLPFRNEVFDAASIGFAIDDMNDSRKCALEILRVLKPGGTLVLLELSVPDHPVFLRLYQVYLGIFPVIGRLSSQKGVTHLRREILGYRGASAVEELLTVTGFCEYRREKVSGGLATIHCARKPGDALCYHARP